MYGIEKDKECMKDKKLLLSSKQKDIYVTLHTHREVTGKGRKTQINLIRGGKVKKETQYENV